MARLAGGHGPGGRGAWDARRLRVITKAGHAALAEEIAHLKLLINTVEHSGTAPG